MAPAFPLRSVRTLVAALSLLCVAGGASAGTECRTAGPGVERCVSGLARPLVARMPQPQEASNWCWAAVVSMVLQRYGVSVPQRDVVQAQFGDMADRKLPVAGIADLLNRSWRDRGGHAAQASSAPLPSWWRQQGLAAPDVLADLDADRPLVVVAREHAMVLVEVAYERVQGRATRVLGAQVLDPSAQGGPRRLRAADGPLDYLARVQVRTFGEQLALGE